MFFRMFAKDAAHYREKGDKLLRQERFAEARLAFQEALALLGETDGGSEVRAGVAAGLSAAGNGLGRLNLAEAEYALNRGDVDKAHEHLTLALELAEDGVIREKAERMLRTIESDAEAPPDDDARSGRHGKDGDSSKGMEKQDDGHRYLAHDERFMLLVQPLPGDLSKRYADLGEEFAYAYLAIHDGNPADGRRILEVELKKGANDILLYELALLDHADGRHEQCELRLRKARELNDRNPLVALALVQLFLDRGRAAESIPLLEEMIERDLMTDQATLILGDICTHSGQEDRAMDLYGRALAYPAVVSVAAERLSLLLERRGRHEEARQVRKRCGKGCC